MRKVSLRAATAMLLTAVGLMASACTVYDEETRHHRPGGWGFHDDHRHRGWR